MTVRCDYCGKEATLVTGMELYPHRPDLYYKPFWTCAPCEAWVGCHPNTDQPLGRLANAELRKAKMAVHRKFDPVWKSRTVSRTKAYERLARAMGLTAEQCHIGMFDLEQCRAAAKAMANGW